jgi:hypothetical protein
MLWLRAFLFGSLGLLCLGAGHGGWSGVRSPGDPLRASTAALPLAGLLGPLRPFAAELVWQRFELRWQRRDLFGQLDDARLLLALRDDVPALWTALAFHFAVDVAGEAADPAIVAASSRAGFEILRDGLRRFPDSAELNLAWAKCWDLVHRTHPDRLPLELLDRGRGARETALDGYWRALRIGGLSESSRGWAVVLMANLLEQILHDEDESSTVRDEARAAADWLAQASVTNAALSHHLRALLEGLDAADPR